MLKVGNNLEYISHQASKKETWVIYLARGTEENQTTIIRWRKQ
jgi:hypothetical protein